MRLVQRGVLGGGVVAGGTLAYYLSADIDTQFAMVSAAGPLMRMLDPETSHVLGIQVPLYRCTARVVQLPRGQRVVVVLHTHLASRTRECSRWPVHACWGAGWGGGGAGKGGVSPAVSRCMCFANAMRVVACCGWVPTGLRCVHVARNSRPKRAQQHAQASPSFMKNAMYRRPLACRLRRRGCSPTTSAPTRPPCARRSGGGTSATQ